MNVMVALILAGITFISIPASVSAFTIGIPGNCPFTKSTDITGINLTGQYNNYAGADTWFPTWSSSGTNYSTFMDGDGAMGYNGSPSLMGFATITGSNPESLSVNTSKTISGACDGYDARYATTILSYNKVLYYGSSYRRIVTQSGNRWHTLAPFAGFTVSTDTGRTWSTRDGALFPEGTYPNVKFGEPRFVDFGQNMQYSPDGKAYLVGFGHSIANTSPPLDNPHWMWGDAVYLARVTPSTVNINDVTKYEFYAGKDGTNNPIWSGSFSNIQPLLEWDNNMGGVTMTYHPGLNKYLMCVTNGAAYITGTYNSYFLESNSLTGPWKVITYWTAFGPRGYFLNIPSKFISSTQSSDGWHLWLSYSAYFRPTFIEDPPGNNYCFNLREIVLSTDASTQINDNTTGTGAMQFDYTGGTWSYTSNETGAFYHDVHSSKINNDYLLFRFNGTEIQLYGKFNTTHGIAAVSVDNGRETMKDTYSSSLQEQQLVYDSGPLTSGSHTLKVRVTNTKNAGSSGYYICPDYVTITNKGLSEIPKRFKGPANSKIIRTEYFNLNGQRLTMRNDKPIVSANTIVIEREIAASGAISLKKIMKH